jgi:hypothetical protein
MRNNKMQDVEEVVMACFKVLSHYLQAGIDRNCGNSRQTRQLDGPTAEIWAMRLPKTGRNGNQ